LGVLAVVGQGASPGQCGRARGELGGAQFPGGNWEGEGVKDEECSRGGRAAQQGNGVPALAGTTGSLGGWVWLCFGQALSVAHDDVGQLAGTGRNFGAANIGRRDHQEPVADLQG
jgi:hypothetical protein